MSILVVNPGSSSLKFGLYDPQGWRAMLTGVVEWGAGPGRVELTLRREGGVPERTALGIPAGSGAAVRCAIQALPGGSAKWIGGVGQRVVHGGARLSASVRVDEAVKAEIGRLAELAPLHNPAALEAIEAVAAELPGVPQVAVFDTAFYATLTPTHFVYPVPYAWYADWGVRRFGFHGVSHGDCAKRAAERLHREPAGLRVVSCHLGNGCSATATRGGAAIATTMGFTPLDGLMMGSRPGSLDPGISSYVQRRHGLTVAELEDVFNHGSGLLGVSGVSSDYRRVEAAARAGDARARLALDILAARVREAIGSLAVTLGGVDALVFTGGIGEHAAELRAAVCRGLDCLGLHLDAPANLGYDPERDGDADVGVDGVDGVDGRILIIPAAEERAIAREVARILGADAVALGEVDRESGGGAR